MSERVWVWDKGWSLSEGELCSVMAHGHACNKPAVAAFWRISTRQRRRVKVCEEHLRAYGRRISGHYVETEVHPDSPAAQRGALEAAQ